MSARRPVTGLNLPPNVGIGETEQKKIHNEWDTADTVEAELAMQGFVQMEIPSFECPQVTEEVLTTQDNTAYTRVYAQQNAWFNYASQILARVTTSLLQAENEMEMIESKMRVQFRERMKGGTKEDKMTVSDMQDQINLDPRYSELKLMAQTLKQKKVTLMAFVDGIERGLRVISRQVEIRKMEAEQGRVNIPGRSPYPGQGGGQNWGHQG